MSIVLTSDVKNMCMFYEKAFSTPLKLILHGQKNGNFYFLFQLGKLKGYYASFMMSYVGSDLPYGALGPHASN